MGPHLAMQCHIEMTEAMIRLWSRAWADEKAPPSASVQTPEQMVEQIDQRLTAMRLAADQFYTRWLSGLQP
jgi:hypothetical protein